MYKSVGVLFVVKNGKGGLYDAVQSDTDDICPIFTKSNPKIIKIKEDNHNEKI